MTMRTRGIMYVQQIERLKMNIPAIERRLSALNPERWAYIIHDQDTDPTTEQKVAPHLHLMMEFANPRTIAAIAKQFNDADQNFEIMTKHGSGGIDNGFAYLIHATENSKSKYQYSANDVNSNFDYAKFIENYEAKQYVPASTVRESELINKVLDDFAARLITYTEAKQKLLNMGGHVMAKASDRLERLNAELQSERAKEWRKQKQEAKEPIKILWLHGKTGTGKSTLARKLAKNNTNEDDIFISGASNDPFQGYNGQSVVILDDLRPDILQYSDLLRILDPWSFDASTKARYKNRVLTADMIIVTCPFDPKEFYDKSKKPDGDEFDQLKRRIGATILLTEQKIESEYWDMVDYDDGGNELYGYIPFESRPNTMLSNHSYDNAQLLLNDLFGPTDTEES